MCVHKSRALERWFVCLLDTIPITNTPAFIHVSHPCSHSCIGVQQPDDALLLWLTHAPPPPTLARVCARVQVCSCQTTWTTSSAPCRPAGRGGAAAAVAVGVVRRRAQRMKGGSGAVLLCCEAVLSLAGRR